MKLRTTLLAPCLIVLMTGGCSRPTKQPSRSEAEGRVSTAPSGQEAAKNKEALVRFANADTALAGELYFENAPMFNSVKYREVTPYKTLRSARGELKLGSEGNTKQKETFDQGGHYTVVALRDERDKPKLSVFKDDFSTPAPGKAKVRIIHAAEGIKDVQVFAAGTKQSLFRKVDFDSASSYQEFDPALASFDIRNKHTGRIELHVTVALHAGSIHTILLTSKGKQMEAVQIEDQLGGPATGTAPKPKPPRIASVIRRS